MTEIKESNALIVCPHCGKQVRLRARTLAGQTVEQVLERNSKARFYDLLMSIADKVLRGGRK